MSYRHLLSADCTDQGRRRKNNEDSLLRLESSGIFCVADGMGGSFGGEVASQAVVESLEQAFSNGEHARAPLKDRQAAVRKAINDASRWIKNRADEMGTSGTGTTVVILVFDPEDASRALALHAGDSRAYRFSHGKLSQVTVDHSVAAAAGLKSDHALPAMFRGVVTRAVGLDTQVQMDDTPVNVEAGDIFLLCSDGLTKMVPDKTIQRLLSESTGNNLASTAQGLVHAANEAGGDDNISVVLVQVGAFPAPAVQASLNAVEAATSATHAQVQPAPTPPTPAPPSAPDRASDPAHLMGVTPSADAKTPSTSEFQQQTPTSTSQPIAVPAPETPAPPKPGRSGKPAGWLMGLVLAALAGVVAIALNSGSPATVETSQQPMAEESPDVGAQTDETAPPVDPVVTPEIASEPLPDVLSTEEAPDLSSTRAALTVDFMESLRTGRWGALEESVRKLRTQLPHLSDNWPEWSIYEAWITEWKRAQFGAPPPPRMLESLQAGVDAVMARTGQSLTSENVAVWPEAPDAQADTYCATAYALHGRFLGSLAAFADARLEEANRLEQDALVPAAWLQENAAELDDRPQQALARLRNTAAELKRWTTESNPDRLPLTLEELERVGAWCDTLEQAEDDFFAGVVDTIRRVNNQKAGWDNIRDQDVASKVYELGVMRVRIVNIRARYKDDVRDWRKLEGKPEVLNYLKLLKDTFPGAG